MPIYEYECLDKGHRFEAFRKIGDRPLRTCEVCGGKVRKLVSSSAFHLKGSGWYKDGYTSSKKSPKSESHSESSSEKKSDGVKESKSKKEKE